MTGGLAPLVCIDGVPAQHDCASQHMLRKTDENDNLAFPASLFSIETLPARYAPEGVTVSAVVSRGGAIYASQHVTASVRLDAVDGPWLGTADGFFPITATDAITLSSVITPGQLGAGEHFVYWNVDPNTLQGGVDRINNQWC